MNYPNAADLQNIENLPVWIDRHFLRNDPYAFNLTSENFFPEFVAECVREYDVDSNSVYCIGSGATGLSFNPLKMNGSDLKTFDNGSDLDIAIISPFLFETAWRDLRTAVHPAYASPSGNLQKKISHQRSRMFDGAIVANKLLSHLSFGSKWLTSRQRMQIVWREKLDIQGDINMWIYRDYWSVRSYAAEGIQKCMDRMKVSE
ncbi:MAG: hypothetical protein ACSHW9_03260 [Salinibacterium amurskyense]